MPAALELADLAALVILLTTLGMMMGALWVAEAISAPIVSLLGSIPLIGGKIGGLARLISNSIINVLQDAVDANQRYVSTLWDDIVKVNKWIGGAVATLADETLDALRHLRSITLAHEIKALEDKITGPFGPIASAIGAVVSYVDNRYRQALEAIALAAATGEQALEHSLSLFRRDVVQPIENRIGAVERTLETEIAELARATGRTVADLEHQLGAGLAAATAATGTLAGRLEHDIAGGISEAERFAADRARTVEHELQEFADKVPLEQIAVVLAAWPAVYAFTQALASEAGLGNAACRRNVGQLCGLDAGGLVDLLGLATIGTVGFPGLRAMVDLGRELASPAVSAVRAMED
jgi:hypothetical protein